MLESSMGSLLPVLIERRALRGAVIGFDSTSLEEMKNLLLTLEVDLVKTFEVTLRKVVPSTYIGGGKLEECKAALESAGTPVDFFVIDTGLSPNQLRNLETVVGRPVIDRPGIILEIFYRHARSKEAKTQVELARLEYLLPRLAHYWTHFERQRGGIGNKGMGEKQIEVDRRLLKKRMTLLKSRLKEIEKERMVQRASRKEVLKVALVGYTNAGKSTLLNALTHSKVLAEDKLFATLDASVRALDPFSHPPLVAIDTVGFISNIPTFLVASFRSTLEALYEADLLLHIVDGSSPLAKEQYEVTEKVLGEMDLNEIPKIVVVNKMDQVAQGIGSENRARILFPNAARLSALDAKQVDGLRKRVVDFFVAKLEQWEVVLPYKESKLEAQLREYGVVETFKHLERGTFYRVRIDPRWAQKIGLAKFRT